MLSHRVVYDGSHLPLLGAFAYLQSLFRGGGRKSSMPQSLYRRGKLGIFLGPEAYKYQSLYKVDRSEFSPNPRAVYDGSHLGSLGAPLFSLPEPKWRRKENPEIFQVQSLYRGRKLKNSSSSRDYIR